MSSLKSNFELKQLPPLSLYIHIPWCIKKCPYCDFNSHSFKDAKLPEDQYIDMLIMDLEQSLPLIWGRLIQTVFIGGGTPSLFSSQAIDKLITNIRKLVNLSPYAEITIEANPGALESKYIGEYAQAGINRLSFGVQSFNDAHLKTLGRIHNSSQVFNAIDLAQKYFDNINLDIIYGLPNQSLSEAINDIKTAISFNTTHISCYNLTIEPNTAFYKNVPSGLPDNDLCYSMQDALIDKLSISGYDRYEISAYAKNKQYAKHNLNYWLFGDYLGIGAGAHSKLSFHDKIIRQVRQKHPLNYMSAVLNNKHIIEESAISADSLPFEFAMNAFRLTQGVDASLFTKYTGLSFNHILANLNIAQNKGFLEFQGNLLKPTKKGQDFLNDFLMLFL